LGAIVGSLLVNYFSSALSGAFLTLWMIILGGALVVIILKLPTGLVGAVLSWIEKRRRDHSFQERGPNGGEHSRHK
jgi:ABC-type branched-subunit amino acid transport system permease subunit